MAANAKLEIINTKLQIVINRLNYLEDLTYKIKTTAPISEYDLNGISLAAMDICNGYIEVLNTLGLSKDTLKTLGFDNSENIKNIRISEFMFSLNTILASDIRDQQRSILVNGANSVYFLLNADKKLKNTPSKRLTGFELLSTFVLAGLITIFPSACAGYLINGLEGIKIGAAIGGVLGLLATLEAGSSDQTLEILNLRKLIKTFRENLVAYKNNMPAKDLLRTEPVVDLPINYPRLEALATPRI